MTTWVNRDDLNEAKSDSWLDTAKASTDVFVDSLKSRFGYGNEPKTVAIAEPPPMDIRLPTAEEWHAAAPWREKPVATPSGTPAAMPTAPRTVDATITAGPRPGQSLQPGESVGSVTLGDGPSASQRGPVPAGTGDIDNSSRESFVRTAYPYMLEAAGGDHNLAELMLAKAISENGDVGKGGGFIGNNFSGLKWNGKGNYFEADTWEDYGQGRVNIRDKFQSFDTPQEGFRAFMGFLHENSRYAPALQRYQQTGDADQLFRDIHAAGYATDPIWTDKVQNIRQHQVAPVVRNRQTADARQSLNAGAGVSPAAPAPSPQAAPGDVPPATGGGSETAMWSPDDPIEQGGAYQAATGRSGGSGVMYRGFGANMPEEVGNEQGGSSYNDPDAGGTITTPLPPQSAVSSTQANVDVPGGQPLTGTEDSASPGSGTVTGATYTIADGRTEPPTPQGDWQPVETVPMPSQTPYGPPLSEAGPEAPPNPYGAPRSIAADINPAAPPVPSEQPGAREAAMQQAEDRYGQVTSTPGEPDYVDNRPLTVFHGIGQGIRSAQGPGGILEPAAGLPRIMGRLSEIQRQAAAELGRNPMDQRVLDDAGWRARNPQLAAEVDELRRQGELSMLGNLDAPRRVAQGAAQIAAPLVRGAAEAVAPIVDDAAAAGRAALQAGGDARVPQMMGSGFIPNAADEMRTNVVPPEIARGMGGEVDLSGGDRFFREAVEATEGARIDADGLHLDLRRFQKPEQAGKPAARTGVYYTPNENLARGYEGETDFGGTQAIRGETVIRRPLIVFGATGLLENHLDRVIEGGMRPAMRAIAEITDLTANTALRAANPVQFERQLAEALAKHGGDPSAARLLIQSHADADGLRLASNEHLLAENGRRKGYDAVVVYDDDYSSGYRQPRVMEVFDFREATYPTPDGGYSLRPEFQPQRPTPTSGADAPVPSSLGSGLVPTTADLRNAAQGGVIGAASELASDEELTPQERLARMTIGAGLGVAAGRRAGRGMVQRAGSGMVPQTAAGRSLTTPTTELVYQGRTFAVEATGDAAAPFKLKGARGADLTLVPHGAENGRRYYVQRPNGKTDAGFVGQMSDGSLLWLPSSGPQAPAAQRAWRADLAAQRAAERTPANLGSGFVPAEGSRQSRGPGKTFAFGAKPGERLEFNVKVVPLSSLVTSHDDALRVNRAFPSELQPRVRERAASSIQIDKIVQTFDPEQVLVDTHRVDSGPMIVGPDMVVESGNGRSIALRRLAQENPEAYAEYVQALRDELPRYGLADDALAGIDQPVLVRERVTDVDRATFAADANVGVQARMAPVEQAAQDAGRVPDTAVSRLVIGEDETIDEALMSAENGGFRRAFMATIPENEWGELLTGDGNLNPRGLARVKDALLAKTYTGASGARLTTAFVDSLDSGIKNVQHGIMGSLPQVARVESRIAAGEIDPGLSIAADMATAADVYSRLRRRKTLLRDYIAQSGMFEGRETTPFQDKILAYLDANARSPKRIRAMLDEYARTVDGMAGAEQVDMFGLPIPQATKDEVLDDVLRRLGAEPADTGADLGRVGAGSNVVEGAGAGADAVPTPTPRVAESGTAGDGAAAPTAGPRVTPEEQLARFQQRAAPAAATTPDAPAPLRPARLGPAQDAPHTGGPEGRLEVENAPQSVGARPGAPMDAPRTGGPEGRLMREGAPPEPANLPPAEGMPATGGPDGTLQSPPTYRPEVLKAFQERIRDADKAEAAAREYQRLLDDDASPEARATFMRNAQDSRWWDRFDTLRYASMLSDPVTHGQNAIGSIEMGAVDLIERPLTALLDAGRSRITGGKRDAFLSEGAAMLTGMAASSRQAVKDAAFIMAHGLRPEDLAKLDKRTRGFSTNIPVIAPKGSRAATWSDRAMEGPLRALSAADALFRGTFQGGHIAAEATRAAMKLNDGKPVTTAAVKRLMDDPDVVARATQRAAQAVLQEDRVVTTAINSMRSRLPNAAQAILSVAVPYIKTPYNIVAQGVGMTPAGVLSLIGDIKAGKPMADRERRVSRMMIGAGVMAWASYENLQGLNTGGYPESEAERSTLPPGWRPYSRKVEVGGETYYVPLALLGPVGIPAMLSVLTTEQYKKGQGFSTQTAVKVAEGVGKLAEDQTFLRSIADFSDAVSKGGNTFMNYAERQASQFSPHVIGGGGVGRRIQAIMGEPGRDPDGVVQAWLATLPYGDRLAKATGQEPAQIRRDVIGRPSVQNPDGLAALVPIRVSRENDAPVIAAFRTGGEGLPRSAPKSIREPNSERAITITPAQKAQWQVAFGQALEDGWAAQGRPRHPGDLRKIEQAARDRARDAVLRR